MPDTSQEQNAAGNKRRRSGRVVAAVAAALLVFIVGVGSWLFSADLGFLKPHIERFVSTRTAREFAIDGELDILLGSEVVVRAEGLRLGDAAWAGEAPMLDVGMVEVRIDLRSVFSATTVINLVDIDDVRLSLARAENGDTNWAFPQEDGPEARDREGPLGLLVRRIDLDRVHVHYTDPAQQEPVDLEITVLDEFLGEDDNLQVAFEGTMEGRSISGTGQVGTWNSLLAGADVRYRVEGTLDTVIIESEGWIDSLVRPHRPELSFMIRGPHIDDLTRLFGRGSDGDGDVNLAGSLGPGADGLLVLDVQGNIGQNSIEARGAFSDLSSIDQMDLDLLVNGPDLSKILRWLGIDQVQPGPYMIDINARRQGPLLDIERANMVFGDAEFTLTARLPSFPGLDEGTVSLDIRGPDVERFRHVFGLPGVATGPFSLDLDMAAASDGTEQFDLAIESALGRAAASGTVGAAPGFLGSQARVSVEGNSLADIGEIVGLTRLPDAPFTLRGAIVLTEPGLRIDEAVSAELGFADASLSGLVAVGPGLGGTDIAVSVSGADLAVAASALGAAGGVPPLPFEIDGRVRVDDTRIRLGSIEGRVGSTNVRIQGELMRAAGWSGSRIDVRAEGPAFEELFAGADMGPREPGPFGLSGVVGLDGNRLEFDDVELTRSRVSVGGDLSLELPLERRFADFDIRGRGDNIQTILGGVGAFSAAAVPFSLAVIGAARGHDWSFDRLNLRLGDATVSGSGRFSLAAGEADDARFRFDGNVPSLASLGTIDGHPLRDQALIVSGQVTGDAEALLLEPVAVQLGDSDVRGRLRYRAGEVPDFEVDVSSDRLVLLPLVERPEESEPPAPEFEDGRMIPDVAMPFEAMARANVRLAADIAEFRAGRVELSDFGTVASLENGMFELAEFGFDAAAGRFDATASLDPAEGRGRARLEAVARQINTGLFSGNPANPMTTDIDMRVESTGADLRALLGNANGGFIVNSRGGQFEGSRVMQALVGDVFQEVINTINPFSKTDAVTRLDCIVLPVSVTDGTLRSNPNAFMRTSKITIATQGTVDLKTERLDINIRTTPRKGITISAGELFNPYVKVVGTLTQPRLAVDEQGVLVTGGAAVATGGISILARALWDRLARSGDPCGDVAREGRGALAGQLPDWAGPSTIGEQVP